MRFIVAVFLLGQVSVGSSVESIGKVKPGQYIATRDPESLPSARNLTAKERKSFTGTIFVLDKRQGRQETILFGKGSPITYEKVGKITIHHGSVGSVLARYGKDVDIRAGKSGYLSFLVRLPSEVHLLKGFQGSLMYTAKTMRQGEGFLARIKGGKVVAIKDRF